MGKLITVIIPVYNVEAYLERCIESVITQNYKELEIILVDDGSKDSSGAICDRYAAKDNRIKVIHKPNGGLGPARNSALDIAKGEYLLFIDSDDYILDGIIRKLYDACEQDNADISCCGYRSGNKTYYCGKDREVLDTVPAAQKMLMCDGMDANAWCKLYKKELFDGIRYPACVYEVVPVSYKVFFRASKVSNIKECGYYLEKRQGSITRSTFGKNNVLYLTLSKKMIEDIRLNYPDLFHAAEIFYLNALIAMTEKSREDKEAPKTEEYRIVDTEFKKNFRKIMGSPEISKRKKMIALLIQCHVYAAVKRIHDRLD